MSEATRRRVREAGRAPRVPAAPRRPQPQGGRHRGARALRHQRHRRRRPLRRHGVLLPRDQRGDADGASDEHFALVVVPDSDSGCTGTGCSSTAPSSSTLWPATPTCAPSARAGLPCVTVGRDPDAPDEGYWVDNDADAATRLSLDHLAAHGARDGGRRHLDDRRLLDAGELRAYLAWCEDTGRRPRLEVVAEDTEAALREAAERLLDAGLAPGRRLRHLRAAGALGPARRRRARRARARRTSWSPAPRDFGLGATSTPPMTTLDYDAGRARPRGGAAAHRPGARRAAGEPRRIIPVSLIERASTAR